MFWKDTDLKGTREGTSCLVRGQSWGHHPIEAKCLRDTSEGQNFDSDGCWRDTGDSEGTGRGQEGQRDPRGTVGGTAGPP